MKLRCPPSAVSVVMVTLICAAGGFVLIEMSHFVPLWYNDTQNPTAGSEGIKPPPLSHSSIPVLISEQLESFSC